MPKKGENKSKEGRRAHQGLRFKESGKTLSKISKELEKKKAEFQSLLNHSPIPIVIYNLNGMAKYINPAFSKTFGWIPEELIGQRVPFVPENQLAKSMKAIEEVLEGKSITDFITKRLTKDGRILVVNLTGFRFFDERGNPSGIIVYFKDITEEVSSRSKIKEERERIFRMLETMEDGVLIVGPEFKIRYLNDKMVKDFGNGQVSFCYQYFRDKDSVCEPCDFEELLDKKVLRFERSYKNKRTYDVIGHLFSDTDGGLCGMYIYRDITDRKRMEEALRKSEAQFRIIVESANDGITYIDKNGIIVFANPKLKEILKEKDLEGKPLTTFYDEENQKILAEHLKRRWQGESTTYEIQMWDREGQLHYMQVSGFPFRDEKGDIQGAVGIYRDITERVEHEMERKRTEDQIRRERETFSSILQKAPYGVILIDQDGKYIYVNPEFTNVTGYDIHDVPTGKEWFKKAYPDPEYRRQVIAEWKRDVDTKSVDRIFSITCRDGTMKEVEFRSTFLEDGGALTVLKDMTEHNRLEQQLRQAQKMEAIGTLAGGIAHDFNNILTAITGYTSLMKVQMDKTHTFYDAVETIERSARRAAELTQQLLGFARKGMYKVEPINLNRVVERVLNLTRETFDRSIAIECHLNKDLRAVEGDSGQLEQVLLNLCLNARDAMPGGGKLVIETDRVTLDDEYVQTHLGAKAGEYVRLQVTDTGKGIPSEVQQKIFDPFFTTKEKGAGMGLAMVYGIVKNHAGYVDVYSEVGRGACFKIYLPASKRVALEKEEEIRETLPRGKETLLIVDDEEAIRGLGKKILEHLGYYVIMAKDGKEASDLYRKRKDDIHLVILDMIMPVMGGKETYRRLKEMNPEIKVLLSSGFSVDGQAREILDEGVQGFIQKPFDMREVASAVRRVLDE